MRGGSAAICFICGMPGHIADVCPKKGTCESAQCCLEIHLLKMECGHPKGVLIPYLMGFPRGFVCEVGIFTSYREPANVEEGQNPSFVNKRL